ncbi:MAG: TIGR03016 family PEP-CTERM system-associated outer membrane protein [Acetobacteraceae bacterium]
MIRQRRWRGARTGRRCSGARATVRGRTAKSRTSVNSGVNAGLAICLLLAATASTTRALAQSETGAGASATPPAGGAAPSAALPAPGSPMPFLGGSPATPQGMFSTPPPGTTTPAPPVGVSVRLGDVGQLISAANAVGATPLVTPSGLTIVPSLGVSEEFNSNIFDTVNDRRSDFITGITPGILVNLSTPSASGTLSYFPTLQIYARNSSQNDVLQNLNGSLDATLLPGTLFLSMNAYASEQATSGGVAPGGVSVAASENRTTTTGFSVQPSFQHRFGDIGTLELIYSLQYSNQNGSAATAPGATQPFFVGSHAVTNLGSAQFVTGPVLGRFNNTTTAAAASESGTGILDGAHQYVISDTLRFAVERRVYIFGTIGYEDIFYPSVPEVRIEDGIWAVGVNLTPGPATSITAGYGRLEGFDSPFLRASIALSPRTTLAASYSNTLGSSLQFIQYALNNSQVDAAGNPIDNRTGSPVVFTNQLLSVQSGLFRNALFSASLITTWPHDTVSLSFLNQQEKLIANAQGVSGFSQNSWSGAVAWTHSLTRTLSASSYFQLGETNSRAVGSGSTPVVAGQLSLIDQLTPTLTGSIVYGITNDSFPEGNALQNIVIVALQKTF